MPAAFNNIVGLKPTRGLISCSGVLPACRTLDCVSILALTCGDARRVLQTARGFDRTDPFSRAEGDRLDISAPAPRPSDSVFPGDVDLEFFGDPESPGLFAAAVTLLEQMNGRPVEIDFSPFREAAQLLYGGPWVAERLAAVKEFYAAHADAFLPVTRKIIGGAARLSAVDAFEGLYRLQALKRRAEANGLRWTSC